MKTDLLHPLWVFMHFNLIYVVRRFLWQKEVIPVVRKVVQTEVIRAAPAAKVMLGIPAQQVINLVAGELIIRLQRGNNRFGNLL